VVRFHTFQVKSIANASVLVQSKEITKSRGSLKERKKERKKISQAVENTLS
jgi:hypothetical protein